MDTSLARLNMVDGQLRPNRITSKAVLARFAAIPRELFVDPAHRAMAYSDSLVPIGAGRYMTSPLVCARLVQELDIQPTDTVLITAAGTGYTATIAAALADKAVAVEQDPNLRDIARRAMLDIGCTNVTYHEGAPEAGWPAGAPYDKIIVDAPADEIPTTLIDQLADQGKLAAVVRGSGSLMEATVFTKIGKTLFETHLLETAGDVLPNFMQQDKFVF